MARRGFLHVLNGDSPRVHARAVDRHRASSSPIPTSCTRVPRPFDWRGMASACAAGFWPAAMIRRREAGILRGYREKDAALETYGDYDEVVFWFEHDLYDQLLLIRHLCWLSRLADRRGTRFSLICIGEFPGVPDFVGLGQLDAESTGDAAGSTRADHRRAGGAGRRAWEAFCAADPTGREAFAGTRHGSAVPVGRDPTPSGGFSLGAQRPLAQRAADSRGGGDGSRLARETRSCARRGGKSAIFMGDSTFWTIATRLASAPAPADRARRAAQAGSPAHGQHATHRHRSGATSPAAPITSR